MPVQRIDESRDGIRHVQLTDPWSMPEVIEHVERRMDAGATGPSVAILFEYRSERVPRLDEVYAWTEFVGRNRDRAPRLRACVVSRPVLYGVARVAMAYLEYRGAAMNVFWTVEDAKAWLREAGGGAAPG